METMIKTRYKWRIGGTLDLYDSGDIFPDSQGDWVKWNDVKELQEENRQLKANLVSLSKTNANNIMRLSVMIDKRQEALQYISEIIEEKAENGDDLELGSTAYKSVRRWAALFISKNKNETKKMSIEIDNPVGAMSKLDAALNLVFQTKIALDVGDILHAKTANDKAAKLIREALDELIDKGMEYEND
jgi:hypothetical protein